MPFFFHGTASRKASRMPFEDRATRFGDDPLDRALQEQRVVLPKKRRKFIKIPGRGLLRKRRHGGGGGDKEVREYEEGARRLLKENVETLVAVGLAYHHEFTGRRLGFSMLVSRHGTEGRTFLKVKETMPDCEIYPDPKPTDELIAINDKVILDPTLKSFRDVRKAIAKAKRPVKLTFVQGEKREESFLEQEERRQFADHDRVWPVVPSSLRCQSETVARAAGHFLEAAELALKLGDLEDAQASAESANEAALMAADFRGEAERRLAPPSSALYGGDEREIEETIDVTDKYLKTATESARKARELLVAASPVTSPVENSNFSLSTARERSLSLEAAVLEDVFQPARGDEEDEKKAEARQPPRGLVVEVSSSSSSQVRVDGVETASLGLNSSRTIESLSASMTDHDARKSTDMVLCEMDEEEDIVVLEETRDLLAATVCKDVVDAAPVVREEEQTDNAAAHAKSRAADDDDAVGDSPATAAERDEKTCVVDDAVGRQNDRQQLLDEEEEEEGGNVKAGRRRSADLDVPAADKDLELASATYSVRNQVRARDDSDDSDSLDPDDDMDTAPAATASPRSAASPIIQEDGGGDETEEWAVQSEPCNFLAKRHFESSDDDAAAVVVRGVPSAISDSELDDKSPNKTYKSYVYDAAVETVTFFGSLINGTSRSEDDDASSGDEEQQPCEIQAFETPATLTEYDPSVAEDGPAQRASIEENSRSTERVLTNVADALADAGSPRSESRREDDDDDELEEEEEEEEEAPRESTEATTPLSRSGSETSARSLLKWAAQSAALGLSEPVDNEDGMKIRGRAKSYAHEASKALDDTRDNVARRAAPRWQAGGPGWQINAINNAAAAVKRGKLAAYKITSLVQETRVRLECTTRTGSLDDVRRAKSTHKFVAEFARQAQQDADTAEAIFNETTVVIPTTKKSSSMCEAPAPPHKEDDRVTSARSFPPPESLAPPAFDLARPSSRKMSISAEETGAEVPVFPVGLLAAARDRGFVDGVRVRVKSRVREPRYGWQGIDREDAGVVRALEERRDHVHVLAAFEKVRTWQGDAQDLEVVSEATDVRRAISNDLQSGIYEFSNYYDIQRRVEAKSVRESDVSSARLGGNTCGLGCDWTCGYCEGDAPAEDDHLPLDLERQDRSFSRTLSLTLSSSEPSTPRGEIAYHSAPCVG